MATRRTILVTGGTGQQGGAVARSLLGKGQNVRIMTRRPDKAQELQRMGAEVVRGDFDDLESVRQALRGVQGVFIVSTFAEKGVEAESEQGKAIVRECRKAGIPHVVYTSVCAADKHTGIPHFESKGQVERAIDEIRQPATILRPVWFMENFEAPWLRPSIEQGVLRTPLLSDRKLQMIALADIGEFASEAFIRPNDFIGKKIDLAGDALTLPEVVARISKALNRPVRYEVVPDDKAEAAVGPDFAAMYRWFNREGYKVDIEALRKTYRIPPTSFDRYLSRSRTYRKAA